MRGKRAAREQVRGGEGVGVRGCVRWREGRCEGMKGAEAGRGQVAGGGSGRCAGV